MRARPEILDRRSEPREQVRLPARVFYGRTLEMWADCTIRDRSGTGAKVEIPQVYKLPARLVLVDLKAGEAFDAVLKWRRGDMAGIQFQVTHALDGDVEARLEPIRVTWRALAGFI